MSKNIHTEKALQEALTQVLHPVIIMAVLDEDSQAILKKYAVHDKVYCHHVTLAFKPNEAIHKFYQAYVGQAYEGVIKWIVIDEHGQAARVEGNVKSQNKHAHCTVSCTSSTSPVYSNQLLDKPGDEVVEEPINPPIKIRGIVMIEPLK